MSVEWLDKLAVAARAGTKGKMEVTDEREMTRQDLHATLYSLYIDIRPRGEVAVLLYKPHMLQATDERAIPAPDVHSDPETSPESLPLPHDLARPYWPCGKLSHFSQRKILGKRK